MERSIILAITAAKQEFSREMARRAVNAGIAKPGTLAKEEGRSARIRAMLALDPSARGLLPSARTLLEHQQGISAVVSGYVTGVLLGALENLDVILQAGESLSRHSDLYAAEFEQTDLNSQWRLFVAGLANGDCVAMFRALELLFAASAREVRALRNAAGYWLNSPALLTLEEQMKLWLFHLASGGDIREPPDHAPFVDSELDAVWARYCRALASGDKAGIVRGLYILVMTAEDEIVSLDFEFTLQGGQEAGAKPPN